MKHIFLIFLLTAFAVTATGQTTNWQMALTTSKNALVQIEYYESIDSPESVEESGKIRRTVNGVVVTKDGLILTSPVIFSARLDISGASLFGRSSPPSDIKVYFQDGSSHPADFVGKDDDHHVAFVRLKQKGPWETVSFVQDSLYYGSVLLLTSILGDNYNNQLMLKKAEINAVIEGPPMRWLSDMSEGTIAFALAFNDLGLPVGVMHNPRGNGDMFIPQFSRTAPGFVEILPYTRLQPFIDNPPVFESKTANNSIERSNAKKWLGINMQPFTRDLAEYFGAPEVQGVLVNTVIEDSPAEDAGLQSGDVLTHFNGIALRSEKNADLDVFRNLVRNAPSSDAKITFWRDNALKTKELTLGDTPISQALADEYSNSRLGFSAKRLTKDIILAKKLPFDTQGVWISRVERAGPAGLGGLRIGDLLLSVNGDGISTPNELEQSLKKYETDENTYIRFFIRRNNDTRFLFIRVES